MVTDQTAKSLSHPRITITSQIVSDPTLLTMEISPQDFEDSDPTPAPAAVRIVNASGLDEDSYEHIIGSFIELHNNIYTGHNNNETCVFRFALLTRTSLSHDEDT